MEVGGFKLSSTGYISPHYRKFPISLSKIWILKLLSLAVYLPEFNHNLHHEPKTLLSPVGAVFTQSPDEGMQLISLLSTAQNLCFTVFTRFIKSCETLLCFILLAILITLLP